MASKIGLGTVQFGCAYGIANKMGCVPKSEVFKILHYARGEGVNLLDTADGYGESEAVIGEYLKAHNDAFKVVSKLSDLENYTQEAIDERVKESLRKLNTAQLYGYLIHQFDNYAKNERLWDYLISLKEKGRFKKAGFSLYKTQELEWLLRKNIDFDIVQLPYSVFDRRFEKYFDVLKERDVEIHVRSIFLQGLAFIRVEQLPRHFDNAKEQLQRLLRLSRENKISIGSVCINFAVMNQNIDRVILGVDSLRHLKFNLKSMCSMDHVKDLCRQLDEVIIEDEEILLPHKWVKA